MTESARDVHHVYLHERGKAMGTSTVRLRWQARRLPHLSDDQLILARAKAIRDELACRCEGEAR